MPTIKANQLQAGESVNGVKIIAVDQQPMWIKIYFEDGTLLTIRNMPNSTIAID